MRDTALSKLSITDSPELNINENVKVDGQSNVVAEPCLILIKLSNKSIYKVRVLTAEWKHSCFI
jgi:hypothetical protein